MANTIKKAIKGKRYRVVKDNIDIFKPGDIVISLETNTISWCVKEEEYKKALDDNGNLDLEIVSPLDTSEGELEEIEGEDYNE